MHKNILLSILFLSLLQSHILAPFVIAQDAEVLFIDKAYEDDDEVTDAHRKK